MGDRQPADVFLEQERYRFVHRLFSVDAHDAILHHVFSRQLRHIVEGDRRIDGLTPLIHLKRTGLIHSLLLPPQPTLIPAHWDKNGPMDKLIPMTIFGEEFQEL